jgi:hypothetical protein
MAQRNGERRRPRRPVKVTRDERGVTISGTPEDLTKAFENATKELRRLRRAK